MELLSFANDMAVSITETTVYSLYHEANEILSNVYAWFCKNKLKLNLLKSKFICFKSSVSNVLHRHELIVPSLKCDPNLNTNCDLKSIKLEKVNVKVKVNNRL